MDITITLSDAQYKALSHVASDPKLWAQNALEARCQIAMDEIFQSEIRRMAADPNVKTIPADVEAVVLAADLFKE
jgi:hypothetical protein